jgi:myo-inositol-1(or 4)-monophosphatase
VYKERIDFVNRLALEAGQLTLQGYGKCDQIAKGGADGYDIATEYDIRTEELIKARLLEEFGEPILGEEGGLIGDRETARSKLWLVDPIDGTFNYQRGLPLYGVSIAFCEEGIPVCGAICLPALDRLLFAARGSGAFLAQGDAAFPQPIRVSEEREMAKLVISLAGKDAYRLASACAKEGVPWRSLRFLLCAALSLAYVASGQIDIFADNSLKLWDCAAGDILLREAGGPATLDHQGVPIFPGYLNRGLDRDDAGGFAFVAVSSRELFDDPVKRIVAAAGLQEQG